MGSVQQKFPAELSAYLAQIGRKGGRKSRRVLSSETAILMVKVREARRAFRQHYARCFWSFDPHLKIVASDVRWVGEQLMKHGDRHLWMIGKKLCR